MAVFYDVSQLTIGDLQYEIRQLTIALEARKELLARGVIDDTVSGNRKYFMTDKLGDLTRQRDGLLAILERWQALFPGDQTGSPYFVQLIMDTRAAIAAAKE